LQALASLQLLASFAPWQPFFLRFAAAAIGVTAIRFFGAAAIGAAVIGFHFLVAAIGAATIGGVTAGKGGGSGERTGREKGGKSERRKFFGCRHDVYPVYRVLFVHNKNSVTCHQHIRARLEDGYKGCKKYSSCMECFFW
jgi:hypothetical protein